MGCDIHIRTEVKRNGKWENADFYKKIGQNFNIVEIYDGRSYSLFTILAGRNYNEVMKPMSQPRGIPKDATNEYKELCELWDGDGHSHSYLTLRELEQVFNKHRNVTYSGLISPKQVSDLKEGILPKSWGQGTNQEGYERHEWTDINHPFRDLVEALRSRLKYYYPYDYSEHEEDIRIVFFFDNYYISIGL